MTERKRASLERASRGRLSASPEIRDVIVEALHCPICLDVLQLPVNLTCFPGCPGTHAKANSTCLRHSLCQHCANEALQLDRPPSERFQADGGKARCIICRETAVEAARLNPVAAYYVNHALMDVMDSVDLGAVCSCTAWVWMAVGLRKCDLEFVTQSAMQSHYLRACPHAVVQCRYKGCWEFGVRSRLAEHEKTCLVGRACCAQCEEYVDKGDLVYHMVATCRMRIVVCIVCNHRTRLPNMLKHLREHQAQLQLQVMTQRSSSNPQQQQQQQQRQLPGSFPAGQLSTTQAVAAALGAGKPSAAAAGHATRNVGGGGPSAATAAAAAVAAGSAAAIGHAGAVPAAPAAAAAAASSHRPLLQPPLAYAATVGAVALPPMLPLVPNSVPAGMDSSRQLHAARNPMLQASCSQRDNALTHIHDTASGSAVHAASSSHAAAAHASSSMHHAPLPQPSQSQRSGLSSHGHDTAAQGHALHAAGTAQAGSAMHSAARHDVLLQGSRSQSSRSIVLNSAHDVAHGDVHPTGSVPQAINPGASSGGPSTVHGAARASALPQATHSNVATQQQQQQQQQAAITVSTSHPSHSSAMSLLAAADLSAAHQAAPSILPRHQQQQQQAAIGGSMASASTFAGQWAAGRSLQGQNGSSLGVSSGSLGVSSSTLGVNSGSLGVNSGSLGAGQAAGALPAWSHAPLRVPAAASGAAAVASPTAAAAVNSPTMRLIAGAGLPSNQHQMLYQLLQRLRQQQQQQSRQVTAAIAAPGEFSTTTAEQQQQQQHQHQQVAAEESRTSPEDRAGSVVGPCAPAAAAAAASSAEAALQLPVLPAAGVTEQPDPDMDPGYASGSSSSSGSTPLVSIFQVRPTAQSPLHADTMPVELDAGPPSLVFTIGRGLLCSRSCSSLDQMAAEGDEPLQHNHQHQHHHHHPGRSQTVSALGTLQGFSGSEHSMQPTRSGEGWQGPASSNSTPLHSIQSGSHGVRTRTANAGRRGSVPTYLAAMSAGVDGTDASSIPVYDHANQTRSSRRLPQPAQGRRQSSLEVLLSRNLGTAPQQLPALNVSSAATEAVGEQQPCSPAEQRAADLAELMARGRVDMLVSRRMLGRVLSRASPRGSPRAIRTSRDRAASWHMAEHSLSDGEAVEADRLERATASQAVAAMLLPADADE